VVGAAAMPVGYGVGDHRMFVVDITTKSMVGFNPQPVKHPKARRLNSRIPRAKNAYNRRYKKLLSKHRLTEKLAEAHRLGLSPERMKEALDKIDEISKECMIDAEKKCRKLRNGKIPFSPEASIWIKRCQFYRSLLRYWAGKIKNRGNLKRSARRMKIENAFLLVQLKDEEGNVTEFNTQSEVQEAIWSEVHQSRYHLAEEAPICNGRLRGEFGYNATSAAARAVLAGEYESGDDFEEATKRLMESIADIRQTVPEDSVDKIITREIWQQKWKKKREATSSSVSTLHFGHYISGADCDEISDFHALKTSLAIVHGIALNRWSKGLCVMLEKVMGVKLINKLRAILLMEADFNASNKIIFGERMMDMDNARKYRLMPEEIFSEKQRMADDGAVAKRTFYDIVRQLKRPAGLASVDAANCYDRVAHAIASLVFQAFGTPPSACVSMLKAIQEMQFYLRTAFGDSDKCVGAKINLKTQGFMQGNGAAPAGWAVVSITIIHAHKKRDTAQPSSAR
jgi:hypothetical protein